MRIQGGAALAQVTGAAQLVLLLLVAGRTRTTDTYVTLFTASQLPGAIIVIGTLQPFALARRGYSAWTRWLVFAVLTSVVAVTGTALYLGAIGYDGSIVAPLAAAISLSAALAVSAQVLAVKLALGGNPLVLSGLTVVPNVAASAALLVAPSHAVLWMCGGLIAGNVVMLVVASRMAAALSEVSGVSPSDVSPDRQVATLLGASAVGAFGPFSLQAATATFPAGEASVLGLASRLAAGVVGVGVTAFTYAVTDWERRSEAALRSLSRRVSLAGTGLCLLAATALALGAHSQIGAALLAGVWTCFAASQACAERVVALRGDLAVYGRAARVTLPLYVAGTAVVALAAPNALAYFAVLSGVAGLGNRIFVGAADWHGANLVTMLPILTAVIALGWDLA